MSHPDRPALSASLSPTATSFTSTDKRMHRFRTLLANIWDGVKSSLFVRITLVTLFIMASMVPWVVRGAARGVQSMFNAPLYWIPRESESRRQFNEFLQLFHAHEMLMVSWPGCTVDDEQLAVIVDELDAVRHRRLSNGQEPMFNQVLTGYTMLQMLVAEPISLRHAEALSRLRGVLVGPDGKTSCLVVEVTDLGAERRRESMGIVAEVVTKTTGLPPGQLIFAGPPIDGIAIDDESIRMIRDFAIPSIAISLALCWLCLQSLWLTLGVLTVGAFSEGLALALIYYSGQTMNAILIVLPPLVFVLTVSAGIHLANYFLDELCFGTRSAAAREAMRKGWLPCGLAALTTSLGLASLAVSEVIPVRQFGVLGAIMVLIGAALVFLVLPGFMTLWLRIAERGVRRRVGRQRAGRHRFANFAEFITRHSGSIVVASAVLLVICSFGLTRLRISIDVLSLLSSDNHAVRNFRWFESHLGPLWPVEVVVQFDPECTLPPVERLQLVAEVQEQIGRVPMLEGEMSAATFFPTYPRQSGVRGTLQRTVFRRRLESSRAELERASYLATTSGGESWRVSARVQAQTDVDYGRFVVRMQQEIEPILQAARAHGCEGISAYCTGLAAVEYEVQRELLRDLFQSFLTALLCVTLVMVLALRSFYGGLLAMIPNVFPTICLFGTMGMAQRSIDIGTVMTASVALGIAVDGTLHFLQWFSHSVTRYQSQEKAVSFAFQHCGRALVQTTVICALGLLIFGFSGFLPARNFACMLLLLLLAALIGDLVILPALLTGRLGKMLAGKRADDEARSS